MTQPFEELLRTGRLPSPSGVGARILALTQDPDATVDDIAEALARDPALTGRILGVANSALNAGSVPMASAKAAAMRLGMKSVCSIAVGFTVVSESRRGYCKGFDYDSFWSVSLATAVAAQALTYRLDPDLAAEAFTAGLMLRVGRLGLASASPEVYTGVLHGWHGGLADLRRQEHEALGIDHAELAQRLLGHWGMPAHVADALPAALLDPEQAPEGPTRNLALALSAAARLAACHLGYPDARPAEDAELGRRLQPLGLTAADVAEVLETLEGEWRRQAADLEVHPLPPVDEDAPRRPDDQGPDEQAPLVLVVDDDAISLKLISNCLRRGGLRVATTADPEEALALVVQHEPAVLMTSWHMAGMDGLALSRALRRCEVGRRLFVMVLTSAEEESACVEAFDAEADDFVHKPFHPREMLAQVEAGMRLSAAQQELEGGAEGPADAEPAGPIDDLAAADGALGEESGRDEITGLPNRVYATTRLAVLFEHCAADGRPLSVIALGLDGLTPGPEGEAPHPLRTNDALQRTAGVLAGSLRKDDLLCAAGGGQLLLLCPNADLLEAAAVADRLRGQVESAGISLGEGDRTVTVSAGVAEAGDAAPSPAALLQLALSALELGCLDGVNRVHAA